MSQEFSVKDSVNLPKTKFKMKANLSQKEPNMIKFWEEKKIYEKMLYKNRDKEKFILHDGPPYANGNIHLGHALNKILKDIIVKYKSMSGFYSPYVPGWDCHGLPIEKKMEQELGKDNKGYVNDVDKVEFRRQCRKYANKYVNIQREQFKRLGVLGDWENPYLTMSYGYEASIARAFGEFVDKGYVYKGLKPVYWCTSCETALAEAEVEYKDHKSPSIYVKFPVTDGFYEIIGELKNEIYKKAYVVIWTTTPWTLPANLAIAFHPNYDYVALFDEDRKEVYIVAEGRLMAFLSDCGISNYKIIAKFKGNVLEYQKCRHPFIDRDSIIVLADYVTLDQGTGCVHTAPGHGQEDYVTGQKYGLEVLCPVDRYGIFTDEGGEFKGKHVFEANSDIVQLLKEKGMLLKVDELEHSYPHCWRCKNPIIFRSTPQWFISMDKNELRENALNEIKRVKWIPPWGEDRISNMIATRPDWCISRQRSWGVPIVAFYCENCGEILLDKTIIDHVVEIFEREGADAWFKYTPGELLPKGTKCRKCGGVKFEKESDILDVWFDSGVSYYALSSERDDHVWPSNLYLEGGDQYRGWFHSSLLASLGTKGSSPYMEVVTHGWVLDDKGLAMSKSLGNVISPLDVIKESGAEILRLFFSSVEYKEDIKVPADNFARVKDAYRKFRNTFRFMLGNLFDFDPTKEFNDENGVGGYVPHEERLEIDRWALAKAYEVFESCKNSYDEYNFHQVYHKLYNFLVVDLSATYFDILKDRLYTFKASSKGRRSAQSTIWDLLNFLVRILAPIISFTSEEVWQFMRGMDPSLEISVFLSDFEMKNLNMWKNEDLLSIYNRIYEVRELVLKALEEKRQEKVIGNSLEAGVVLSVPDTERVLLDILKKREGELRYIFIVSKVEVESHHVPKKELEDKRKDLDNLKEKIEEKRKRGETVDDALNLELEKLRKEILELEEKVKSNIDIRLRVEKLNWKKCERCWNYSPEVGKFEDFPTVCERCIHVVRELVGEKR